MSEQASCAQPLQEDLQPQARSNRWAVTLLSAAGAFAMLAGDALVGASRAEAAASEAEVAAGDDDADADEPLDDADSVDASAAVPVGDPLVERGRYLAAAGNCVSCHTTEGGEPYAGGHAFVSKFGTMYSTNITPDADTGIGGWTLEQFATALREGERPDGEHLYPAFPYTAFTKVTDEDVEALYAYFMSLPAVSAPARENELKFPYNQRWALGLWKKLYFTSERFTPDASQSEQWNRGAYLVDGLGHCSSCHTPRNFLGAEVASQAMTGGTYMDTDAGRLRDWSATNLTSAHSGLGLWSEEDIFSYLKYGIGDRAGSFGPMNKVILNSTRHLTEDDVRAMAVYLKSLPANERKSGSKPSAQIMAQGSQLYDIHCGTCHLPTGLGSDNTAPPLVGSPVALAADPSSLINIVIYGPTLPWTAPSDVWNQRRWQGMEPFGEKMTDEDLAALLSFVRNNWENEAGAVTVKQIQKQR